MVVLDARSAGYDSSAVNATTPTAPPLKRWVTPTVQRIDTPMEVTIRISTPTTGVGPGRLLADDATQFGSYPDGSHQLRVLWDSEDWNLQFSFNRFNVPVVANCRLIVPTYDGRADVYG